MRTLKKRLALFLSSLMLVSVLPTSAWAEEAAVGTAVGEDMSSGVQTSEEMLPTYMSLLPLEETRLKLDLTHFLPGELESVSVQYILDHTTQYSSTSPIPVEEGDTIVWAKEGDDNFQFVGVDDVIDLSAESEYDSQVSLTLIVGNGDQLDASNQRYEITVSITPVREVFTAQAKSEKGAELAIYDTYVYSQSGKDIMQMGVDPNGWQDGDLTYMTLNLQPMFVGLDAVVYKGLYDSEEAAVAAGAEDITAQIWGDSASGYLADYSYQSHYQNMPEITLVLKRDGQTVYTDSFVLLMYASSMDLSWQGLYTEEDGARRRVQRSTTSRYNEYQELEIGVDPEYPVDGQYYFGAELYNPAVDSVTNNGIDYVQSACVGYVADASDMPAAGSAEDIKEQLFAEVYQEGGYLADYSNGVIFSVLDTNGDMNYIKVTTVAYQERLPSAPEPDSADTYFQANGADESADGAQYDAYTMSYGDDSYYYNGYQTVFLLKDNDGSDPVNYPTETYRYMPVSNDEIVPLFYTGSKVTMYAGEGTTSGTKQESGVTSVPFVSGEPIQYSAAAENGSHLKNYWVTYLTLQPGPKLFVNATNYEGHYDEEENLPVREIFLDEAHNYRHDIFVANIGTEELTGLTVTLSDDAQNIALDEYWKVREGSTQTLGAFDSVYSDEMDNMAKIRLVAPEGAQGEISGTLTISADGQEDVVIKLTGVAGIPKITTTEIRDGVKYVPYSSVIQTNNMNASDAISFSVISGRLPNGVELKSNGELYGVPTEYGEFNFTVKAAYEGNDELSDTAEFTMTVLDNTNENVEKETDAGYELDVRVPEQLSEFTDQVFESRGELSEFQDFWLDGEKLEEGVDYIAENGSTKITIKAQTFQKAGGGTHTIAAEFRVNGNVKNELKKAAQNYTAPGGSGGSSTSDYSISNGVKSENGSVVLSATRAERGEVVTITVKPDAGYELDQLTVLDKAGKALSLTKKAENVYTFVMPAGSVDVKATFKAVKPEIIPAPGQPFLDVAEGAWYVDAVKYAYENKLMAGVSSTEFLPQGATSRGMVVTILYSMEGKPAVSGCAFTDVSADAYYAAATCWASQNGIVTGYGDGLYGPNDPVTREQMAIIMMNYAKYKGCDVSQRADLSAFTDLGMISVGAQDALSWANAAGLLAGKGNGILDPVGQATRAETAAILGQLHRMMADLK